MNSGLYGLPRGRGRKVSPVAAPAFVGSPWWAVAQGLGSGSYFAVNVWVPVDMRFSTYGYRIITPSGNMWLATYDSSLRRVHYTGSFTMPASSVIPPTIPGGLFLPAGNYWIAVQFDNSTAALACSGGNFGGQVSCYSSPNTYANGAPPMLTLTSPWATAPGLQLAV